MKEEYYAVGGEYNRRVDDAIPKSAALRMVEEAKKEFPWQYWAGAWVWDSEKPVSDVIKWFEKWFGSENGETYRLTYTRDEEGNIKIGDE